MLKTLLNSQLSSSATSPVYYDSPAVPSIGHIQLSLEIKGSQSSATSCLVRSFHLLTNDFILLVSSLETGVTWLLLSTLSHPSQQKSRTKTDCGWTTGNQQRNRRCCFCTTYTAAAPGLWML